MVLKLTKRVHATAVTTSIALSILPNVQEDINIIDAVVSDDFALHGLALGLADADGDEVTGVLPLEGRLVVLVERLGNVLCVDRTGSHQKGCKGKQFFHNTKVLINKG